MPDPSNRHWRHPSELAATAGATAPPTIREAALRPLTLSGVLAVGAVSGLLVALSIGGFSVIDTGGIGAADSELVDAVALGQRAISDADSDRRAGGQPTTTVATTTVAAAATSTSLHYMAPASSDIELWSATTSDEVLLLAYGVFASPNVEERLASYLVYDGMVLTSAAAVSGRDKLWLRVAGRWAPASIAMADPYTDVAVLQAAEPLPERLSPAAVAEDRPEPGTNVRVRLGPTGNEPDGGAGRSGVVVTPPEPVKTSLNRQCYDAFSISVRSQLASPGSAVVDGSGTVIGMTISTHHATAAAVPMETVLDVAHSMMDLGSPAAVWLGIEAVADAEGRTRVIDVVAPGPAADVLMADDVIVSIDGQAVENPDHLVHLVRAVEIGVDTEMVIERAGATESVSVRPGSVADRN